jgi:hypothetical protein
MHQIIKRFLIAFGLVSCLLINAQAEVIETKEFNARQRKHGENFSRANGIVTDEYRGLQWQDAYSKEDLRKSADKRENVWLNKKDENHKPLTYKESLKYCQKLELGGFQDWRVPSKAELRTLIDHEAAKNIHRVAFHSAFIQVTAWNYWVSENQMTINFQNSYLEHLEAGRKAYIKCVRGQSQKKI